MSNLGAVRSALATAMQGLGFTTYATIPGSPDLPAVVVGFPELIEYHGTYAGHSRYTFPITLLTAWSDEETAQHRIDTAVSYRITGSVVDALESYSGPWRILQVDTCQNFQSVSVGEGTAVAADLTLIITA